MNLCIIFNYMTDIITDSKKEEFIDYYKKKLFELNEGCYFK